MRGLQQSKILAVTVTGLLLCTGCSSVGNQLSDIVFMPNANSDRRDEAEISLELAFSTNAPILVDLKAMEEDFSMADLEAFAPAAGGALGILPGLIVSQIGASLAQEAERYTASYSAEASSDGFYHFEEPSYGAVEIGDNYIRDTSDIRFAGFRFDRLINDGTVEGRIAMSVCAIALPGRSDDFFYLFPVSYQMRYSKAKLVAFDLLSPFGVDLLNPWEIVTQTLAGDGLDLPPMDNDVDLTLAVSFEYLSYNNDNKLTSATIGPNTFDLKRVKVTGKPVSGYFPTYRKFLAAKGERFSLPCDETSDTPAIASVRDEIMKLPLTDIDRMRLGSAAKLFPSTPRAFGGNSGNGNFMMKVEITEFDDYGGRVREVSDAFDQNEESLTKKLTDLFDG